MPRKLSPEHQLELESHYKVVSTIAEWCDSLTDPSTGGQLADSAQQLYEARDLRSLRMLRNDFVAMTSAATAEQALALDSLLRQRANTTLEQLHIKKTERIERIRRRGQLTSEEQYHLVRDHVEFISGLPERAVERTSWLRLIRGYEERPRRRRPKE